VVTRIKTFKPGGTTSDQFVDGDDGSRDKYDDVLYIRHISRNSKWVTIRAVMIGV
jgi:hypothetical protein